MAKKEAKKQSVKVDKQLPLHQFVATGKKPSEYKGRKK